MGDLIGEVGKHHPALLTIRKLLHGGSLGLASDAVPSNYLKIGKVKPMIFLYISTTQKRFYFLNIFLFHENELGSLRKEMLTQFKVALKKASKQ